MDTGDGATERRERRTSPQTSDGRRTTAEDSSSSANAFGAGRLDGAEVLRGLLPAPHLRCSRLTSAPAGAGAELCSRKEKRKGVERDEAVQKTTAAQDHMEGRTDGGRIRRTRPRRTDPAFREMGYGETARLLGNVRRRVAKRTGVSD